MRSAKLGNHLKQYFYSETDETNLLDEINKIPVQVLDKVVYYMLSFLHKQYRNDYSCIAYD